MIRGWYDGGDHISPAPPNKNIYILRTKKAQTSTDDAQTKDPGLVLKCHGGGGELWWQGIGSGGDDTSYVGT